jgi:hypothetical protein
MFARSTVIVLSSALFLALGTAWLAAEDKAEGSGSAFAGRVLAVYSASDPEAGGAILVEPRMSKLGEQTFLVGRCPDLQDPAEWRTGRTVWLSLADVAQIVEFDNVEQYRKAIEKAGLTGSGL